MCMTLFAPVEATEHPTEIIDTVEIEPNAAILAKNEVRETKNWNANTSDNTLHITYNEAQLIMMVAQAEAGNQGKTGMLSVMDVIMNRVESESDEFPDSVSDVIFQPGQFETVTTGKIYEVEISPECHEALAELEKNRSRDERIIAFETSVNGRSLSRYFTYLYTVEDHDFYTIKND